MVAMVGQMSMDLEIVLVLVDRIVGMTVEASTDSLRHNATAVYHSPMGERFLCSNSRLLGRLMRRTGCWDTDSTWDVAWAEEDHTWHPLGCK